MHFLLAILCTLLFCTNAAPRIDSGDRSGERGGPPGRGRHHPPPPFGPHPPVHHEVPFAPHGPPPEFLAEASEKAHRERFQIFMEDRGRLPKAELMNKFAKWAENNHLKDQYEEYLQEQEKKAQAHDKFVRANLAGEALSAYNKLWEITQNDKLSRNDECKQAQNLLDGLKMNVRAMVPLLPSGIGAIHGGPPAPGCFPEMADQSAEGGRKHERKE